MRLDSLAFRLIATAALWTLVALPLAGLIIFSLYKQEVDSSFDERLKTLLLVVYTDSSDHAQGEPGSPRDVGEPGSCVMLVEPGALRSRALSDASRP